MPFRAREHSELDPSATRYPTPSAEEPFQQTQGSIKSAQKLRIIESGLTIILGLRSFSIIQPFRESDLQQVNSRFPYILSCLFMANETASVT